MEKELNEFKIEVLTQLAVINSKLDGYTDTQKTANEANTRSKQNEQDIQEMKARNDWAFKTAVGAVIISVIEFIFLLVKIGIGVG